MTDNAIYSLLSADMAVYRESAVIADALANAQTIGYKDKQLIFKTYLSPESKNTKLTLVNDIATSLNLENGPIKITNNSLDFAIEGNGFFKVAGEDGDNYTKAGKFSLNEQGELVDFGGRNILNGSGSKIFIGKDAQNMTVDEKGSITVNGENIDSLGVVFFENPKKLAPIGESLFAIGDTKIKDEGGSFRIFQGRLEVSNVNNIKNLTEMIEASRRAQAIDKLISQIDNIDTSIIKESLNN